MARKPWSMSTLDKCDPFFDFHFGVVTTDLDTYISAFDGNKVPYFASTFTNPETHEKCKSFWIRFQAILQMVYLSFASSDLDRDIRYFEGVLKGSKMYEAGTSEARCM